MFLDVAWRLVVQYFFHDDFIPNGHGQVASGYSSLPDPISLEAEEEQLAREKNECDAVGDYECRWSVERMCLR